MTTRVTTQTVHLPDGTLCARLTLAAGRANSLEPGLLSDLGSALDWAEAQDAKVILLCGGPNFSSGGDVRAFHVASLSGEAATYANEVVLRLQTIVARLIAMPRLVVVAARGAITGGSAGLLFAADLAVLAPDAFVQPYYAKVGFAPDGGWTALLPERIGAGQALEWLQSDRRLIAPALCEAGLATAISDTPEEMATELAANGEMGSRLAAKGLIWDDARRARINARLAAETAAFLDRIVRPDTALGMSRFLERIGGKADV
ncbi:enoyl-CoA hydratase/carnithine racemase (plasmid) [Hoeflea sp. IMCC20628]|uniref:enoyl-CoA hydratase/isomerase family protein n=1 Tax=Hoeflea sp. IMCC20628 TaxID=1620421 RepID=UPI00063BD8F6|nr:enoyl-CoA hydratase/isomerase family protein [Hoeflea sp. IMCC20628]AKI03341.1 enoyl-CoA hydratase/carnithine racemase [Hoeflea sp. IMCC20628]